MALLTCEKALDHLVNQVAFFEEFFLSKEDWVRINADCGGKEKEGSIIKKKKFIGLYRCADGFHLFVGWGTLGGDYFWAVVVISLFGLSMSLFAIVVLAELTEDLDLINLSSHLNCMAEAMDECKLDAAVVLAWAGRWDLPELVWDEHWEVFKEFRRCPATAFSAFDFWAWRDKLAKRPVEVRSSDGPQYFDLALLIPYAKLVSADLGKCIQWRGEKGKEYATLYAVDDSAILPKDECPIELKGTLMPSPERPAFLRKPKPPSEIPLTSDSDKDEDEKFDNRDEETTATPLTQPSTLKTCDTIGTPPTWSPPLTFPSSSPPHSPFSANLFFCAAAGQRVNR